MAEVLGCNVDDLEDGQSLMVEHDPQCIAVFRVDGEFCATADLCTHADWPLSADAQLDGHEVECGLHLARFDVRTGEVIAGPATVPLKTYPVRVEDGAVWINVGD
jgi:nitrite reductase/ring-hydroxylating ferredoxin subunit